MKKNFKTLACIVSALAALQAISCQKKDGAVASAQPVTIMVAAAASLENAYTKTLIPRFNAKYPNIIIEGTYDSSGKLQTQIEQGLQADVFMSAAKKQMNTLVEKGFVSAQSVIPLLENKLVLIKKKGTTSAAKDFATITQAKSIAIGDPASVPAGQYAEEAFSVIGNWKEIFAKASLGTNVTEVLGWVAAGSAEVGVVYATDAASQPDVEVITFLPEGILSAPVIYPVAVLAKSGHPKEAAIFVEYLASPEGLSIFKEYGFSENKGK
ncbi:MAG: molybdate ABC transporter substrate-binding protein [Spirochaetaceae bacterium]|jgi:molybdate transport system substrate-binding protein|nr:molybdate ABC transporter substrate-binding protein [Spirochaetaceae bacterium]